MDSDGGLLYGQTGHAIKEFTRFALPHKAYHRRLQLQVDARIPGLPVGGKTDRNRCDPWTHYEGAHNRLIQAEAQKMIGALVLVSPDRRLGSITLERAGFNCLQTVPPSIELPANDLALDEYVVEIARRYAEKFPFN